MKNWIKWPRPGEFRGEGDWIVAKTPRQIELFNWSRPDGILPGYIPTHIGETPPNEQPESV